jgi:hypothetical protein
VIRGKGVNRKLEERSGENCDFTPTSKATLMMGKAQAPNSKTSQRERERESLAEKERERKRV